MHQQPPPSPPPGSARPGGVLPAGSVDTHLHVLDPQHHPYAAGRDYTPPAVGLDQLAATPVLGGCAVHVLVQPSVHGTDNGALLDVLERLGPARGRSVGVVETPAQADDLVRRGRGLVAGLRLNLQHGAASAPDVLRSRARTLGRIAADRGLFIEVYAPWRAATTIVEATRDLGVPVLLDHFAGIRAMTAGPSSDMPLAGQVARMGEVLVREQHAWVKLSAPERVLGEHPDLSLLEPAITAYLSAASGRVVWGSDWPHTGGRTVSGPDGTVQAFREVDDAAQAAWFARALRDAGALDQVLVHNPRRLFGLTDTPPDPPRP